MFKKNNQENESEESKLVRNKNWQKCLLKGETANKFRISEAC